MKVISVTPTSNPTNIISLAAYVDLKQVSPVKANLVSASGLKSDGLFTKIIEEVNKNQALAKSINGVFLYNITENGKTVKQWSKYSTHINKF